LLSGLQRLLPAAVSWLEAAMALLMVPLAPG
jgi:hypothetical protein